MSAPRNVTPLISMIRNLLLGRKYKNHLRYETHYSPRTLPPPNLPEGVTHKLADNYYTDRDGRREITPPEEVYVASSRQLSTGKGGTGSEHKRPVIPGCPFNWKTGKPHRM